MERKRVQRRMESHEVRQRTIGLGKERRIVRLMLDHDGEVRRTWNLALFWLGNLVEGTLRKVNRVAVVASRARVRNYDGDGLDGYHAVS